MGSQITDNYICYMPVSAFAGRLHPPRLGSHVSFAVTLGWWNRHIAGKAGTYTKALGTLPPRTGSQEGSELVGGVSRLGPLVLALVLLLFSRCCYCQTVRVPSVVQEDGELTHLGHPHRRTCLW